jgi:hypothetical protein
MDTDDGTVYPTILPLNCECIYCSLPSYSIASHGSTADIQEASKNIWLAWIAPAFADWTILPENNDDFDAWYRSLPIHKIFLVGKESEIHYLAPENEQSDYPFVYVGWNVNCELGEEDEDSEQDD